MATVSLPTSKDIYIEVNGKKLAVVQSYKAKTTRDSRTVEAFGSQEPVGTVGGRVQHILELSRVYLTGNAQDGVSFFDLSDFNVVIVKPDRKIIYSGCEWAGITETAGLGDVMVESVTVAAAKRMELR